MRTGFWGAGTSSITAERVRLADFAHQGGEVTFGIAEESHPELMVRHSGDQPGLGFELNAARAQHFRAPPDVGGFVIDDRAPGGIAILRGTQHEPRATTIEESH